MDWESFEKGEKLGRVATFDWTVSLNWDIQK